MTANGSINPGLRYDDARAAITFLVEAFGFTEHFVVPGEDDRIEHAQLVHDTGMVMLGSARDAADDPFSELGRSSVYVVVPDPDAHHAQAVANGAEVVMEPMSPDYGGRTYTALDTEGNYWSFGDYDPWV